MRERELAAPEEMLRAADAAVAKVKLCAKQQAARDARKAQAQMWLQCILAELADLPDHE
ncbi:hypothetical protein ABZT49_28850 [Methylobacterium sp. EM32]|uniref:hypothetical protein n=1 Tax=Methylobacterium TaxID=407 RepID=UPI00143684CA|nr:MULTISPECIES: hypothetical protein [Methylobacterium]MCF4124975.1 hypothetical protein [Methylobacterium sp. SyP6R]